MLLSILLFYEASLVNFLSNSIPVYARRDASIVCEYIEIQNEVEFLNKCGIEISEQLIACDLFNTKVITEINSYAPILVAAHDAGRLKKYFLVIGYGSNNSLVVIQQQYPQTLTYEVVKICSQEVVRQHLNGIKGRYIRIVSYRLCAEHRDLNNNDKCASDLFAIYTLNKNKLFSGVDDLNSFNKSFRELIKNNENMLIANLINDLNDIINACRVTMKILGNYSECIDLFNLKSSIESSWCYIRNKLMKSNFSNKKIANCEELVDVLGKIYENEHCFVYNICGR